MSSESLLSASEHKILFAIGILLCGFYFTNIADKIISAYNETIKAEQIEKERLANNRRAFSFEVCVFRRTPIYETVLAFQFITIPLLVLSLRKHNLARFMFSLLLTILTLLGYLGWILETSMLRQSIDYFREEMVPFNNYFLFQSTVLEFVSFLLFAILLTLQLAFLLRFVIEKFQAKIS